MNSCRKFFSPGFAAGEANFCDGFGEADLFPSFAEK
jgi:hypothetical protein